MDYTTLSDADLDLNMAAIIAEKERRRYLMDIPNQITALKQTYISSGGDPANI